MTSPKDRIITLPNYSLRQRSKKVGVVTDEIKQLVADMEAATLDWEDHRENETAVALAAVQIDQHFRVVIVRSNFNDKNDRTFSVLINPEVTKLEGEIVTDYEGCLSVTDVYGMVPRHNKVRVKAIGLDGRSFRIAAEGFLARVLQHEVDHTHGKVFVDLIKTKRKAFYKLNEKGDLEPLDYATDIKNNRLLWE